MGKYELIDNKEAGRYEYRINDYCPQIEYKKKNGVIALTHTRIPPELRGQGVGTTLVKDVLDDVSKQKLKLVPLCSFVAGYIKKNPEYRYLIKEGIYIG